MTYKPRILDAELQTSLRALGAVLIEGPKWCGKTMTARQVAASEVRLDVDQGARDAAAVDPALVLDGDPPRLIDEWQVEPRIWDHVRRAVDDRGQPGQFILTGSAVPPDDATRHTGAGRFTRLRMRPMSLYEAGVSTGRISLRALLAGEDARSGDSGLSIPQIAEEISVGGWPGLRGQQVADALIAIRGYLDEIRRADVGRVDGVKRDPEKVLRVLQSLARNVTTFAAATTLASDAGGADGPLHDDTVRDYLDALTRLFIVEDQPAWEPHLRSRYRLRRAPKRHFVDPALAVAALRATPEKLLKDLNLFGLLFESLVIRDLRIYAQATNARVMQYHDSNDLEVDAIVETDDGRWAAFEVKLGDRHIDSSAKNLAKVVKQIDTSKAGEPSVVGVITGTGYGYVRPDGVQVIPIGALGP